eukprot:TRINITY_DN2485_c0_g1_i6.p1 TRINITY_DN2485_c0_g1~~TRINITY_DN2485_c0_g1_i6.p1  ORF type:complete len:187 (+),score=33.37 TRINITY_DN2485_c0_g1_i6:171-731(+)
MTSRKDLLYSLSNVTLFVGSDSLGSGTLSITTKKVVWENDSTKHEWGFIEIIMHAVSPPRDNFPACIYCHLDSEEVMELRFCPPDEGHLDEMFYSFNEGAELNPDPLKEDENEEGHFFFNSSELGLQDHPNLKIHESGLSSMSPDIFLQFMETQGMEVYEDDLEVPEMEICEDTTCEDHEEADDNI